MSFPQKSFESLDVVAVEIVHTPIRFCQRFLRATAVPAGTAESGYLLWEFCLPVCLSVRHDPVRIQGQLR